MAVAYYEKTTTNASGTGTSYTPALPTAPADGWKSTDAFVAVVFERGGATTHGCSTTGWSRYGSGDLTLGSNLRVSIWWARGTSVTNPTITKGSSQGVGYVLAFRNVIGTGSPFDAGSATALTDNTSAGNGSTTAITTGVDGCAILHVIGHGHATNSQETYTVGGASICTNNPSWTTAGQNSGSSTTRISSTVAIGLQQVAGSTGAQAYTESVTPTTTYHTGSLLLALKPAAESVPTARLGFADSFAVDDLAAQWTGSGAWSISGGALRNTSTAAAWEFLTPAGTTFRHGYAEATIRWTGSSTRVNRVGCRYIDGNNWLLAQFDPAGTISLFEYTGASLHGLGSWSSAFSIDTDYTLRIEFDGPAITVKVNGTERITARSTSMYDGAPLVGSYGTAGETQFRNFAASSPSTICSGTTTLVGGAPTEETQRVSGQTTLRASGTDRVSGTTALTTKEASRVSGATALWTPSAPPGRVAGTTNIFGSVTLSITDKDAGGTSDAVSLTVWPPSTPTIVSPASGENVGSTPLIRGTSSPYCQVEVYILGGALISRTTAGADGWWEVTSAVTLTPGPVRFVARAVNISGPGAYSPSVSVTVYDAIDMVSVEGATLARAIGTRASLYSRSVMAGEGIGINFFADWYSQPLFLVVSDSYWTPERLRQSLETFVRAGERFPNHWVPFSAAFSYLGTDHTFHTYSTLGTYEFPPLVSQTTQWITQWAVLSRLLPDLWDPYYIYKAERTLEWYPKDAQGRIRHLQTWRATDDGVHDDYYPAETGDTVSLSSCVYYGWAYATMRDAATYLGDNARAAAYDAKVQEIIPAIRLFRQTNGYYAPNPVDSGLHHVTDSALVVVAGLGTTAELDATATKLRDDYLASTSSGGTFYRGAPRVLAWQDYWPASGTPRYPSGSTVDNSTNGGYWPGFQARWIVQAIHRVDSTTAAQMQQDIADELLREMRIGGAPWEYLNNPAFGSLGRIGYHGEEGKCVASSGGYTVESASAYVDVSHPGDGSSVEHLFLRGHRITRVEVLEGATGSVTVYARPESNTEAEAWPLVSHSYGTESTIATMTLSGAAKSTAQGDVKPAAIWGGKVRIVATANRAITVRLHQPAAISVELLFDAIPLPYSGSLPAGLQPIPPGYMVESWNETGKSPKPLLTGEESQLANLGTNDWRLLDAAGQVISSGPAGSWWRY